MITFWGELSSANHIPENTIFVVQHQKSLATLAR